MILSFAQYIIIFLTYFNNMTLAERITMIVEYSKLSIPKFSGFVGFKTPQAVRELIKGNTKTLSDAALHKITTAFPEISPDWLLTGEGEMLRQERDTRAEPQADIDDEVTIVPLLPIAAQAGSLSYFAESVQLRDCEMIVSPIKGADYAMRVSGDSMSPEYPNGSQVLIKRVDPQKFMDWGRVFVLDTYNGTVMKQVTPGSQPDRVRCISKNPDPVYAPFEVMWDDVIGVYRVLMCMSVK